MKKRVIITAADHPHCGKSGTVEVSDEGKVSAKVIFGKEMIEVQLEEGVGPRGCYVGKGDIQLHPVQPESNP